jgi:hypothetical protein
MKKYLSAVLIGCSLLSIPEIAFAEDELIVFVLKGELTYQGATLVLDGEIEKQVPANGLVYFDLNAGAHSLQLLDGETSIHSFRFNSAGGQVADITLAVDDRGEAQAEVQVETYNMTESVAARAAAPTGSISGVVRLENLAIANATVEVAETGDTAITDVQGRYTLRLPRGEYELKVDHPDAESSSDRDVRVVSNLTVGADFSLNGVGGASFAPDVLVEDVLVLGSVFSGSFGASEQFSSAVVNTIGIEELARYGDSDIAASVVRVPAVTVQDDRYVFIRGLGGRYITATLNGATMPSTDPNKRTVPLDLFPSNIVENLQIRKSFLASFPGETTGGNLAIDTRSFPDERAGGISVSLGGTSGLTGDNVATDPLSGDWDVWGADEGTRQLNPIVSAVGYTLAEAGSYLNNSALRALRELGGEQLLGGYDLGSGTAGLDISIGANFGDLIYIGDADLGYFVSANYRNKWSQKQGISHTYEADGGVFDAFDETDVSNDIDLSGLVSFSLNIGQNTFESVTLVSRVTESGVQTLDGVDGDQGEPSVRHTIDWIEQQFVSQQFLGEHQLADSFVFDWQVTASQAARYAPDRREVRFDLAQSNGGVFNLEVPSLLRRYDDLVDDNTDASFDFSYETEFDSRWYMKSVFDFGAQTISRERKSDSNSYGYFGGLFINDDAPNLLVSDVLTVASVTGDTDTGFAFSDKTLASDSYQAEMGLTSFYFAADTTLEDRLQILIGARHDAFEQTTDTFNLQTDLPVQAVLDEDATLPSLALNWFYGYDQQLRFAWSETVSRPDFKEASNAVFYDTDFSDIRVRGNPNLQISSIRNFDLRWESYGEGQDKLSVAAFYKEITDAIERVELTASGTAGNSRTFQNTDKAELYGIELDGYREFALNDSYTKSLFVALNASFIESSVEDGTSNDRQLQGQPEYTFNLILGYDDISSGQEITLLFNQNGKSVRDVGVSGKPDIIEEPVPELNLTYSLQVNERISLSAKATNILDAKVQFTQFGQPFREYSKGLGLEAGLEWNF